MDSNKGQGGIQLLLAAEQEAQHIIASARAAKTVRLKQAKEEAEREIAAYRAQRESEFRKKVAESSGDSGSNVKRLEEETHIKIEQLKNEASKVSPEVVAMLMKYVTTVRN
ncbi:V-type proton ATPase subunit G1 [Cryptomeria japonica]|uniref:V-type proton ATPase subunit G1 n=1 Tax=Cryptomeria japonica TaxID=3369 RepID=UPI0025AD3409|nr:V-type proton ATPase subunit G1 [Cryptomeria japonica]XP_057867791.1 V-type proton ATPase subunit G1 [Cryptomeria japonica]